LIRPEPDIDEPSLSAIHGNPGRASVPSGGRSERRLNGRIANADCGVFVAVLDECSSAQLSTALPVHEQDVLDDLGLNPVSLD